MTAATIERKYALSKVDAGDYLLPSNDAETIWRIRQYEDGPSHGVDEWPRDRTLWGVWRWKKPPGAILSNPSAMVGVDEIDEWEHFEGGHLTRQSAIDSAIKISEAERARRERPAIPQRAATPITKGWA